MNSPSYDIMNAFCLEDIITLLLLLNVFIIVFQKRIFIWNREWKESQREERSD